MSTEALGNAALEPLVGKQVVVQSLAGTEGYLDRGVIEEYDHPWVRLRKETGEVMCFTVYHIRLVKIT